MATVVSIYVRFSDSTFGSFVNTNVTEATLTEIQTGGTDLFQVAGVSAGQAFTGKVATHAIAKVQTDGATTGAFCYAYFRAPSGDIICPIQGGGASVTGMEPLYKAVPMQTGVTLHAKWDALVDGAAVCSLAVVTASGKCDVFFATSVSGTATAMVNEQGASIGQSLQGQSCTKFYATAAITNGLDEAGAGNGGFFLESSTGILKGMFTPARGNGQTPSPWLAVPIAIEQNDTLQVLADKN